MGDFELLKHALDDKMLPRALSLCQSVAFLQNAAGD